MLLDLDDTLTDHTGAVGRALPVWLGADVATPAVQRSWREATERHLAEWRAGRIGWAEQRRRRMGEFLPRIGRAAPGDAEALDRTFDGYSAAYRAATRAFDDALPTLEALRELGIPTAVLSNGSEEQQRDKLARTGLDRVSGPLLTSEAIGVAKPQAEAFLRACAVLGLPPEDVLMVGDAPDTDVVGALAAGLQAVLLDRRRLHAAAPRRIETLADLLPLVAA